MTRELTVYSDDLKAEAIALAELYGYRPAEKILEERGTPVSHQLIHYWHQTIQPERFAAFCRERTERFESELLDLGLKAADALYIELEQDPNEIKAGIAMDKTLRLLQIQQTAKHPGGQQILIQNLVQTNVPAPDKEARQ